jgi:hypothetical protein
MNTHNEVCTILSAGGVPIQPDDMLEMMELVKQKTQRLSSALEKALDKGHVSQADLGRGVAKGSAICKFASPRCDTAHLVSPHSAELEEPSPETKASKITEAAAEPMLVDGDSASDDEDEGARAAPVLTPKYVAKEHQQRATALPPHTHTHTRNKFSARKQNFQPGPASASQ